MGVAPISDNKKKCVAWLQMRPLALDDKNYVIVIKCEQALSLLGLTSVDETKMKRRCFDSIFLTVEFFLNNTNLIFLASLYRIDIQNKIDISKKIKLPAM